MPLTREEFLVLEDKARDLRLLCIDTAFWAGSAHIGGAMSVLDILTILYNKYMNIDPKNPDWEDRDRLILSKGHAAVAYVCALADRGYFDIKELTSFNKMGSKFGMHPDKNKIKGCDASTGSLGHGLPIALGLALAGKLRKKDYYVYTILGDGECDEGSVWEAAMAINHYKAVNVITFIDRNNLMIDGPTEMIMNLEPFAEKWKAFGFNVIEIDGHNMWQLSDSIENAKMTKDKPTVIICNTVKSCGIKDWEGDPKWHYAGLDDDTRDKCKESIRDYHAIRRDKNARGNI